MNRSPPPSSSRDTLHQAEDFALRREAADVLRRSRWYRDECLRELLLERRWFLVHAPPPRSIGD
jgi:hypothetical protein